MKEVWPIIEGIILAIVFMGGFWTGGYFGDIVCHSNHLCETVGGVVKRASGGITVCGLPDGKLKAFEEKK